ncbi:MAG TPA: TonB-dependent receptor [Thermoanaerobaculia bacterium]|nr:TonB-dependent receptor [Thermoanaerobaculia bacterium]
MGHPRPTLKDFVLALWLAASMAAPVTAHAAGRLAGAVLNGLTGQPVPGASVTLATGSVTETTTTDLDGLFRVELPAGSYRATVSKKGFATQDVTGVEIADGGTGDLSLVLMPQAGAAGTADAEAAFGDEITVAAEAGASTQAAILAERKQAVQISDLIGAEEIAKNTGSDAAGVLKRVTGISLQEDKYVYVRGLGDRYSNTLLNGSKIPSTELERKVVPLDLFPADLLDKVRVSKSYTADKPGDFAAGFVELETLQFPTGATGSLSLGAGSNSETTGENLLVYGDGLSFSGGGGQPLPSAIPGTTIVRRSPFSEDGFTPEQLEAFGDALVGDWAPSSDDSAPLAPELSLSYGNTFGKLGVVVSASHDAGYRRRVETNSIYRVGADGGVVADNTFDIDYGEEQVRQSALANFAYRLSPNHHLQLRSLYTDLGSGEGRVQEGFYSDQDTQIRDFRVSYQEQEIVNLQLSGDHYLPGAFADGSLLEWRVSGSQAETAENRREVIYQQALESGEFLLTDNAQSGFLFFNDLADDLVDSSAHWTTFVSGSRLAGSVKAGLAWTDREREFGSRRLRYFHRNTRGLDLTLSPEELFTEETIGPHFELQEITRATDNYRGQHGVGAAYAQADLGWGAWRLIGGLRYEQSELELFTVGRGLVPDAVTTVLDEDDLLPALSVVYQLTARQNLRGAYSRTVNRPDFRELAPFKFTHIVGGYSVVGNPELVSADIDSYDLRWEWFPSSEEVVAASLFYKDFANPIENVVLGAAELLETYENADGARNYGLELELRRDLGSLARMLREVTAIVNYTWVDSEIRIDPTATILTNPTRALVGQPDQVANLVLEWARPAWGTGLRLLVNHTGEKVAQGGALGLPDVLEEARSTLDLVYRQDLGTWFRGAAPGLTFKLSGANLLGEEKRWTQGGETFRVYEPGRELGVSLSYSLF